MKRHSVVTFIYIGLMCLLLTACNGFDFRDYIPGMWDPHQGERPTDYAPSKWTSENPYIWFEVIAVNEDNTLARKPLEGEIILADKTIKIRISFDGGKSIFINNAASEGGLLLSGTCIFDSKKLIVSVDIKNDAIFEGQYSIITFIRNQ